MWCNRISLNPRRTPPPPTCRYAYPQSLPQPRSDVPACPVTKTMQPRTVAQAGLVACPPVIASHSCGRWGSTVRWHPCRKTGTSPSPITAYRTPSLTSYPQSHLLRPWHLATPCPGPTVPTMTAATALTMEAMTLTVWPPWTRWMTHSKQLLSTLWMTVLAVTPVRAPVARIEVMWMSMACYAATVGQR